jgi:hypothetical protein
MPPFPPPPDRRAASGFQLLEFILSKVYDRYYLAQTSEDQVLFAVNPKKGGFEHHEHRRLTYLDPEKMSPHRLLPVIRWARGGVDG